MSQNTKEEDEVPSLQRPPSPPPHTTFAARGIHPPTFSAFKPRDYRFSSPNGMTHVAWSCDGKKLAAVGIDKATRIWNPEKSLDPRSPTIFTGGHSDDVDYISWNPTHPELFCTSSSRDRRIVFWDARQSRNVQNCPLKVSPVQTNYSPDGRNLLFTSTGHQLFSMSLGRDSPDVKEQWKLSDKDAQLGSRAIFNHTGDGVVVSHHQMNSIRVLNYPSWNSQENPAAHVGGCVALALDPRGIYLASGGSDAIVNLFDVSDWVCARTISACDHAINSLSFSHDGEYLAIANAGLYIDIVATETGVPMHRVPALAPSPTVAWHPSRYAIAYCGQTKTREGGPPPVAVISTFGLLE
ncbi:WD40 repeat-like protein [Coprinopsis marcescibilis]|uniref:WD40 repeat-like protein n=1 Tax=Coprinopsis marcescibilis TaxID=230819 RepID=A0A5C3KZF7_COPMA|nr:WD40 repeat-like protein [Coprinopsis marcescibilis]